MMYSKAVCKILFPFFVSHAQEPGNTAPASTEQPQRTEGSESGLEVETDGYGTSLNDEAA